MFGQFGERKASLQDDYVNNNCCYFIMQTQIRLTFFVSFCHAGNTGSGGGSTGAITGGELHGYIFIVSRRKAVCVCSALSRYVRAATSYERRKSGSVIFAVLIRTFAKYVRTVVFDRIVDFNLKTLNLSLFLLYSQNGSTYKHIF